MYCSVMALSQSIFRKGERKMLTKIEMEYMETMIMTMREISKSQKQIAESQERIIGMLKRIGDEIEMTRLEKENRMKMYP